MTVQNGNNSFNYPELSFIEQNPELLILAFQIFKSPQDLHSYSYVTNNPLRYFDVYGGAKNSEDKARKHSGTRKKFGCLMSIYECARNARQYNKECQQECASGGHGGSMYQCAIDKCPTFESCIKGAFSDW